MKRHIRDNYYVVGEGVLTYDEHGQPVCYQPSTIAELRKFRFSRLGPPGGQTDEQVRTAVAAAMTATGTQPDSQQPAVPAGFTYLGQFIDHDLTLDNTAAAFGDDVTVSELVQGRSPALDLDSLYGRGPESKTDRDFYAEDGVRLKVGKTAAVTFPDEGVNVDLDGFDLPRAGFGSTPADRRAPLIPDHRNDENLAVAQTHLAFMRFHNRVADELAMHGVPSRVLFAKARESVVRHYQWMVRTDFLPRVVDPVIVTDVFTNGRRFFDAPQHGSHDGYGHRPPGHLPTMPIEFSVAAYRLGHSMIRGAYQWNRVFNSTGPGRIATLLQLFTFTGVNGNFSPNSTLAQLDDPNFPGLERLPTNWIADFQRLYDFTEAGRPDLAPPAATGGGNVTKRIDTLLVDPLAQLPLGAFGGRGTTPPDVQRSLPFRNLTRANMVSLASGQQMAKFLEVPPLSDSEILTGAGGANLDALTDAQQAEFLAATPLFFYILREAELNGGRLTGVGGRIVAETFHRAIEGSRTSIVRDPSWRPTLGPDSHTFRMTDLLLFAFEGKADLLNPLGDAAP
jgi:Animal haem peroxidase